MITLTRNKDIVTVCGDETPIGTICLFENPYHKQNCYIKLQLKCYDNSISEELFEKLSRMIRRPLQAMVRSNDTEVTSFLAAGGFVCKRKCYEVEAAKVDYVGASTQLPICWTHTGEQAYDLCCKLMYEHYIETHKDINPWTAGVFDFCENLPGDVCCEMDGDKIVNLAFVEDNEIAYIYGTDPSRFSGFAAALISNFFARHETVFFESDDCDWAAMRLRALFANQDETSFDTYIYTGGQL